MPGLQGETVNPGRLIDEGTWSPYQKLLILGTALAIVADGLDSQLLPNAVPTMIRAWGQSRGAFTTALAIGPFGMMIGGLAGGLAGDRFGRRPTLIACVAIFGVLTCLTALVDSIAALSVLRLLAGIGLGGAMPTAVTLAAEYVPIHRRPFAVTATIVCMPLGGAIAGELAAALIPVYGWRSLFVVGGALPLALSLLLLKLIPESPKFLASRPERWSELRQLLRRSGHDIPADATFAVPSVATGGASLVSRVTALFRDGFGRDTVALWAAYFFGLMVNYVIILLLPALLTGPSIGFSQASASRALAMSNYGGVAGALLGALALQRYGSRRAMLAMSVGAVACGIVLAGWPLTGGLTVGLIVMLLLTGGLINGVQTTMSALAAHVYPTANRSTGVGTAVAIGRIGNVVAAFAGSRAIDQGGPRAYFGLWSVLMVAVAVALACITRHVAGTSHDRH